MKVSIEHKEITSGIFRKVSQVRVSAQVQFSELELAIIRNRNLKKHVLVERELDQVNRSGMTFRDQTDEQLHELFDLRVDHLLKGKPDTFTFDTPLAAKLYETKLIERLREFKSLIEGNMETGTAKILEI